MVSFLKNLFNWRYYKENFYTLIILLFPILVSVDAIKDYLDKSWYYWGVSILIFLGANVISIKNYESKNELKNRIIHLEEYNSNLNSTLESIPIDMIKTLGKAIKLGNEERITLYRVDSNDENKVFVPVARFSDNPNFKQYGRSTYPLNQGYIGQCWEKEEIYVSNLESYEKKKRKYISDAKKVGMEQSDIESLSMKSRSFFGKRLHHNGDDAIAILIIESMNQTLPFEVEELKKYLQGPYGMMLIDSVQKNIAVGKGVNS